MAAIFPVIMCGGAGTRLWPASRPSRPKQFIPLSGNRSPFQETVDRVAPLVGADGVLIVVGGVNHHRTILKQLAEVGETAVLLLEPEARDSAAAMATAALWTHRHRPNAINLFVASDHHIPDQKAFREAVMVAVPAAEAGRIVTLGLVPTKPSSAYGYIAPAGPGLAEVRSFIEKPDSETAARYISAGYLWNSGNFIVRADVLNREIEQSATGLSEAVAKGLDESFKDGDSIFLGEEFAAAPRISIDYAVMETTQRASVLPVDFEWSDLGSWDAVHASGEGDVGLHILEDSDGCLVRACDGVMVAAIGLSNVGVIVERDAILVTDLSRSQDVKKIVERLGQLSPRHLDFSIPVQETLDDGAVRLAAWLRQSALPCWCTLGQNSVGGFEEFLSLEGRRLGPSDVARVQLRQIHVYADAGRSGWQGPWRTTLEVGLNNFSRRHSNGEVGKSDASFNLHNQGLLAGALARIALCAPELASEAWSQTIGGHLLGLESRAKDLAQAVAASDRSSACISLLEAALTWEEADEDEDWSDLADQIVDSVRRRFLDAVGGIIRELAAPHEEPVNKEEILVDPGRQFEWAWLMARHARANRTSSSISLARRLFQTGLKGIDPTRDVVMDTMTIYGAPWSARARLTAQTQWMKAALILASLADGKDKEQYLAHAARAQRALWKHLLPSGLWRAKLLENGKFIDEPASANPLHSIMAAHIQTRASDGLLRQATRSALQLR
ncbi:sugar phosphate nucleotidyltransferase [Brevundimonas vesicularis]|uniref:sugar phosphate nucleotidyltransferase n=1 Tax=Brevundimonas vesicularis TaxID=41276 RepID=UPI0022EC28A6|nr:sugar phosphate nucleotidyltransferase [Brevundimonas vesicularis]WBT06555.1 sugar phosphate nucleotidyltransferase [Brevundimonas vesicularis]